MSTDVGDAPPPPPPPPPPPDYSAADKPVVDEGAAAPDSAGSQLPPDDRATAQDAGAALRDASVELGSSDGPVVPFDPVATPADVQEAGAALRDAGVELDSSGGQAVGLADAGAPADVPVTDDGQAAPDLVPDQAEVQDLGAALRDAGVELDSSGGQAVGLADAGAPADVPVTDDGQAAPDLVPEEVPAQGPEEIPGPGPEEVPGQGPEEVPDPGPEEVPGQGPDEIPAPDQFVEGSQVQDGVESPLSADDRAAAQDAGAVLHDAGVELDSSEDQTTMADNSGDGGGIRDIDRGYLSKIFNDGPTKGGEDEDPGKGAPPFPPLTPEEGPTYNIEGVPTGPGRKGPSF